MRKEFNKTTRKAFLKDLGSNVEYLRKAGFKEIVKMWKTKLEEFVREKKLFGEKINIGATEKKIQLFIKTVKDELDVDLPNEYIEVLRTMNGVEFNGFILYGIDQRLLDEQQNEEINGLIEYNKIWYENEWQKQYIFLGESNISWYVYDLTTHKFCELDNPSGTEVEIFDNLDYMVEKFLSDALE